MIDGTFQHHDSNGAAGSSPTATPSDDRRSRVILSALVVLLTCTDHVGSCHRETVQCVRDAAMMDLEDEGFLVRRALPVSTKQVL
jgi:hypothetical protein